MRLNLIAWLLLAGCTTSHPLNIAEQCEIYPAVEWTKLSAPPAEAEQLLKPASDEQITERQASMAGEVWFRSDSGTIRYCRYTRSKDPCDGPEYRDFQFYYGKWNAMGGLSHICVNAEHR